MLVRCWPVFGAVLSAGCAGAGMHAASDSSSAVHPQYASTYQRPAAPAVLIRNATALTAAGPELARASLLFADGKIVSVVSDTAAPAPPGTTVIDGTGKFVT